MILRITRYALLVMILLVNAAFASDGFISNGLSVGYTKAGSAEIGTLSWKPDLKLGPWAMGFDAYLPLGNNKPEGFDSIVFRYAEFNDGQKGLRYGVIDGLTLGHGLLMKNYSTRTAGPITQNNQQTALKGFVNFDNYGLTAMTTWSHISAVRFTEKVNPMLTLGQTYVTSVVGPLVKESVSGIAVDASVPLPFNFEGYAETAQLFNHGTGTTVGINWGMEALVFSAMFDAGYRFLDKQFVPGYFNADYETNPVNFASYEANNQTKDGYLVELKMLASNAIKLNAAYEAYRGSNPTLYADASTELDKITASLYFKQPNFQDFRSLTYEQGAITGGSIGYKINPNMALVTNYKKAYDPILGKLVESQNYEIKLII